MRLSHIGWNLAGLSLPLIVAALSVPSLMERIGVERFGLLALSWGLIGYAGVLDIGIGRALTQLVARWRGDQSTDAVPHAIVTASRITLVTGTAGGCLLGLLAATFEVGWLETAETPASEIRAAILLMAIALPAQAMSATYRGLNEAYENFKSISLLRIALGVINFGGPWLVSLYTSDISALVATIVASRIAALAVYRRLAWSCIDEGVRSHGGYSRDIARQLFIFGGWVTLSSIVSPILVQADRFVIGAVIAASAVTVYVLPYEIVVQSLVLVGAISTVAFPTLARMMREQTEAWQPHFWRWLSRVAVLMAIVCTLLAYILPSLMRMWLGPQLDEQSIVVGQILCLGVFANSIGVMFYSLLHAKGRADVTAKLHLFELPFFLVALVYGVTNYGVEGAAWVWVARMTVDATILWRLASRRDA